MQPTRTLNPREVFTERLPWSRTNSLPSNCTMLSGLMSAVEPLASMRATAVFWVSIRSLENSTFDGDAGFLFTCTPTPLLRSMAAETSSAHRDTGRIAIMGRQTKCRHLDKKYAPQFPHERLLISLACGYGSGYWLAWCNSERWRRDQDDELDAGEVDESPLHVGADEFDAQPVAHIESLWILHEQSLDARLQNSNEGSLLGSAGDHGVEDFANSIL